MSKVVHLSYQSFIKLILLISLAFTIAGCSSGGGGSTAQTLSGTAATGDAIDGVVSIYGANGGVVEVPIAASGNYAADVTGLTPPFCICAVPDDTNLATQYSYSSGAGTANVTPLTTLALFYANGEEDPANLITTWPTESSTVIAAAPDAQATVNANFVSQFSSVDFATYDFLTTPFSIGDTFDQILDALNIDISSGSPVITVNGSSFAFNPNIDISGIDIGGVIGGITSGTGSGQLTISGLTPSSFTPINFATTDAGNNISSIAWASSDFSTIGIGLLDGVVVQVQVSSNRSETGGGWFSGGFLQAVPGASFDGTTLTLNNVTVNAIEGTSPQSLTLNGSLSK